MSSEALRGAVPSRALYLLRAFDGRVLLPTIVLVFMGLVALGADRPEHLETQAGGALVGACVFVAVVLLPYRRLVQLAYPFYAFSLLLLLLLFVPGLGRTANNATRWLQLGPVGLQPSEFAKVAVVFALARYIRFRQDHRTFRGLFVPFLLTLVPLALIVKQPDLGTALMLVPVLFVMLWAAGARPRHLLTVCLLGVLSIPLLYAFALKPYQQKRVRTFVQPLTQRVVHTASSALDVPTAVPVAFVDPTPAKEGVDDFHVSMSLAAVAGGGALGQGFADGELNRGNFVPESWTDFIFSVWAEEWGFVGVLLLLLAQGALLVGLAAVARDVKEPCARLLAVGAVVLLGFQACVNLAMTVGLAPITGLPLPFLSFGRTSMVASWFLLGLALNARRSRPIVFGKGDFA